MDTLGRSKLPAAEVAQFDAFRRKQTLRNPKLIRHTLLEGDRVGAGVRVLRVLVVAADQGAANALLRQARYAGHGAHAAPDGLVALRVANAWHPDVVLLDMDSTLMDACQVAKDLRSDPRNEACLMIAFAQWVDDARREPCLEAGIDLMLSKPVDRNVVETLLMLECVRVNQRVPRRTMSAVDGPSTFLRLE